jgi:hypothetical protein
MADATTNPGIETAPALPDTATVDEAALLMGDLAEESDEAADAAVAADGEDRLPQDGVGQDEAPEEAPDEDGEGEAEEVAGSEPGEVPDEPDADGPPAFWSAEDRAAWAKVPAELRPVLAKYERQRTAFVNHKVQEAAVRARDAEAGARQAQDTVAQAAQWWAANADRFARSFVDKWAGVDWNKLAEESPAEWARLRQQRDAEADLLRQADERGAADIAATNQRVAAALREARRVEHAKLAERLPDYFGGDKAGRTYDELGRYLHAKGIPVERINAIYEAPVIELALNAMRFEQAQKKAAALKRGAANGIPATATPKRVEPGPAGRTGNRTSDATRQVRERFGRTGSVEDAARLISLHQL